ncbi:GAF domain-containing protein, partial [Nocardioides solisilvae]|uniref:GAF domain-containing protein n=1 Tax=Nocardioides solisilvae TaxID=1542435 RepID=UPI000D74A64E
MTDLLAEPSVPLEPTALVETDGLPAPGVPAIVRHVLDGFPASVLLADSHQRVAYVNEKALEDLRPLEAFLPLPLDQWVGADVRPLFGLLGDVGRFERVWGDPSLLPFETVVEVGDEVADLSITGVTSDGQFGGVMLSWIKKTSQVREQRKLARVHAMLENSPTKMMFANAEGIITYLNPASLRALEGLAEHIVVRPEELVGVPLAMIYEEQDAQRAGLLDPQGTLARSEEKLRKLSSLQHQIGPETLDGTITEMFDDEGHRIGFLLTWEIVTEKLQIERDREQALADTAAMNHVLGLLGAATSVDEVIDRTLEAVCEKFQWDSGVAWRVDPEIERLRMAHSLGVPEEMLVHFADQTLARGEGMGGKVWASAGLLEVMEYTDIPAGVRKHWPEMKTPSAVGFPVRAGKDVVAVMEFFSGERMLLNEQRLGTLRNIGDLVSQAVARIQRDEAERAAAADLASKVDLVLEVVRAAGEGDLTREMPVSGDDAIGELAQGLGEVLRTLRGSLGDIGGTADSLAVAAEQLSALSQGMGEGALLTSERAGSASGASVQVSASIQTVATAAEEMTASIREIAKNATEAATVATTAVGV